MTLKNGLSGSGTSQLNFKERVRFETLTVQLVHLFHIQAVFETPLQSRQNCAHLRLEGEKYIVIDLREREKYNRKKEMSGFFDVREGKQSDENGEG